MARTLVLLAALAIGPAALGCPNCKEAVANQAGESASVKDGYSRSILLMMGMPFALLGLGGLAVACAVRRGVLPEL